MHLHHKLEVGGSNPYKKDQPKNIYENYKNKYDPD